MALVGGGGAGNTAGSGGTAGIGQSLNYIGDHCHAESGPIAGADSEQTVLNFTTSSDYIVATLTLTGPIRMTSANIGSGLIRGYQLNFNGQTVGLYKVDPAQEDMPTVVEVHILIPAYTAVVLTCIDSADDSSFSGTANITGRVYA